MGDLQDPIYWRYVFTYHMFGHIFYRYSLKFRPEQ